MNIKKRIAITATAIVLTTAATTAGSAATTATATPRANPGTTHLTVWTVNSDGPYFNVIATGAIGDNGQAVTVHPDGTVDPEHTSQLELNLAHGSFRLSIIPLGRALARALQNWTPSPSASPLTCSGGIRFTVPAPVIAGSGTGTYRGLTGTFTVTVHLDEVLPNPPCINDVPPIAEIIVLDATGSISR